MTFISCDWGTSTFRLRLVGAADKAEFRSDDGTAKLATVGGDRAETFRTTLVTGLEQLRAPPHLPVVISGMASSTIGWKELPYARTPFRVDGRDVISAPLDERTWLLSGLRTETDVMRGEETQVLGLFEKLGFELPSRCVVVLPGTHSKHVDVDCGAVKNFRTFMTGEVFDVLARQSVLRHSTDPTADLDVNAFMEGVSAVQTTPLLAALFQVRTRQVLQKQDAPANTSFLSGLLIGSELTSLARESIPIWVAAGDRLRTVYELSAKAIGLESQLRTIDSEDLCPRGQAVVLQNLLKSGDCSPGFPPSI